MIRDIVSDRFLLNQKGKEATRDDLDVVRDLLDTIKFHEDNCVGMAANMIGVNKRIIVVKEKDDYLVMLNPEIIKFSKERYKTKEACLSLSEEKEVTRYQQIKVKYLDINFKQKIKTYNGFIAQIIQHEIDHCNGIVV